MDVEGLMDSESDDGAEVASEGNSVHASKQGNSLDTAAPRGSPPKPSQNRERGDAKPSKRMKLPDEKKRSSYGDAFFKSLEAQTASAERASERLIACRDAELQHRKNVDEAEVKFRMEDLKIKRRNQRHDEILKMAKFRRELGEAPAAILAWVNEATAALDNDE